MSKIKNNEITHSSNSGTSNIILGSSGEVTPSKLKFGSDAAGDIAYYNGTGYTRLAPAGASKTLKMNSSNNAPEWVTVASASPLYASWAQVYELAGSSGVAGGSFTSGAMRTRILDTEEDPDGIVSLSSNQFTLGAGTYRIWWSAPGFKVSQHTSQLYNATDSSVTARGSMAFSHSGASQGTESLSVGLAIVTISGSKAFEIQHQAGVTCNTEGFGNGMGGQIYKFTVVEIIKEA